MEKESKEGKIFLLDTKLQFKPTVITEKNGTSRYPASLLVYMRTEYVIKHHQPMKRKLIIQKIWLFFF